MNSKHIESFELPISYSNLLRQLSMVLQSSVDPAELQEAILHSLVHDMGYRRALIGLYEEQLAILTGWIVLEQSTNREPTNNHLPQIGHTDTVYLKQERGPLVEAVKSQLLVEVLDGEPPTSSPHINDRLIEGGHYLILPMSFAGQLVGVIVVDHLQPQQPLSSPENFSLEHLASYAAMALSSTNACIYRAQRTAIIEERHRIAAELHDNVSQTLYGLAYGLDACIQMLADKPNVQDLLTKLHATVVDAQSQMRQLIFDIQPDNFTADTFVAGLHRHLRTVSPTENIALSIDLPGQFDCWSDTIRMHLYRVAQEALANAAKHAAPHHVYVKLRQIEDYLELEVTDDGQGFNPAQIDNTKHFGIQSMARRIEAINGHFEISSIFGKGTIVTAKVLCK